MLGAGSGAAYLLTFAPAFFYRSEPLTLATLLPFQLVMWAQQTQVLQPHTYQSDWWSWPLMLRPIWYLYEPVAGVQRGILLIGNPVVMWGGLVAVVACLLSRDRRRLGVAALWVGSYAVWAVIPKSLGFFYYYYLSSLFLPLAITAALHGRARLKDADETVVIAAAILFAYFYPILAATPLDRPDAFRRWAWFESWV
jgi:dolichyl-phosphate-mannose-protein mannosyltransferase